MTEQIEGFESVEVEHGGEEVLTGIGINQRDQSLRVFLVIDGKKTALPMAAALAIADSLREAAEGVGMIQMIRRELELVGAEVDLPRLVGQMQTRREAVQAIVMAGKAGLRNGVPGDVTDALWECLEGTSAEDEKDLLAHTYGPLAEMKTGT